MTLKDTGPSRHFAAVLLGCFLTAAPATSGPLLDAAIEAEKLAAQNDARGAFEAIRSGLAAFSQSLPLTVPRAIFVTEVPKAYRAYAAKAEPVFTVGEKLITYVEVTGLKWQPAADNQRQSHFTVDLELTDDEGKTLALQKEFGNFTFTAHSDAVEVYTHLTLDVAGAKPGGYVLRYTVNDVIAERSTPFELPFTLKEKS
ncbi:hypothetical protein J2045_002004 [Peteryoungia aggregata LMG 23059]|uniref:Uncharacterized protein n=1 Tax=Peteryoungia aggregata LMG 23059 TaxID=1368425 RepID=A0ABU0G6K8_9HYPH|nr:hypothetical protein [Peteryoungia aggregata]MDQ0420977.1 hypothetical protein [Peteryoungia aggregata LMG 23059]